MVIPAFIDTARTRPAVVLAALGLVSGLLSGWLGMSYEPAWLRAPGSLFLLEPGSVPIGVFFAAAMAAGVWVATGRTLAVPVLLLATLYAWSGALQAAMSLLGTTYSLTRLILASLVAGAVGAGLTHLGAALVFAELRAVRRVAVTVAVGAVAGLLYVLGDREIIDLRLLFVVWQPAVAYCIGLGLGGRGSGA
jgi:hypothetical protein